MGIIRDPSQELNSQEVYEFKPVVIGIVLPDLLAVQKLVRAIAGMDIIDETEFTFGAPLYKGNDAIVEGLKSVNSAIEKFDVYFEHGILDEEERVRFAGAFRKKYLQKFPGSEGSDVFVASADVLQFRYQFGLPTSQKELQAFGDLVEKHPNDPRLLYALFEGKGVGREHLKGRVRIYLDHIYNPRRRKLQEVQDVMTGGRRKDPVVLELAVSGGVPGLHHELLEPLVDEVDGALVWLPG